MDPSSATLLDTAAARSAREHGGLVRSYERGLRELEREGARLLERAPEVSGWSPAQHRFHLCLASELVVRNLRTLLRGSGRHVAPAGLPIPEALPLLARGRLPLGADAPRMVTPPEAFELDFLGELLTSGHADLLALAPELPSLAASRAVIPHQALGPLTAPLWLRFGRMHALHHERIVARVRAARR